MQKSNKKKLFKADINSLKKMFRNFKMISIPNSVKYCPIFEILVSLESLRNFSLIYDDGANLHTLHLRFRHPQNSCLYFASNYIFNI